jgi:hypothetical protein
MNGMGEGHWTDSRFSFAQFRYGLRPRFWNRGSFGAPTQCAHKKGLNFARATLNDGRPIALEGAFYMTKCKRRGEGACSPFFAVRSHLPLRGKLGWMTQRVGVKTTLTMERAFSGFPVPSGNPTFLPLIDPQFVYFFALQFLSPSSSIQLLKLLMSRNSTSNPAEFMWTGS